MNPNPRFDTSKSTQSIRSDIDSTRQRMDAKIDAIGERLKGRHLVDEVVGFFRSKNGNGTSETSAKLAAMKDKVTESAGQAIHSTVETVKAHPLPSVLIGAGIAWLLYENARPNRNSLPRQPDDSYDYDQGRYGSDEYAEDSAFTPQGFGSDSDESGQSTLEGFKEKASDMKQSMQEKASQMGDKIHQGAHSLQQRASEMGSRVQQRAQQVYTKGRQQVSTTAENHPLEMGLGLLGLGLIAGLALPTPRKVNQLAGPAVDRLRRRTRDRGRGLIDQSKHVVQAATTAAREEAQNQGLTPTGLREKVGSVAQHAKLAAQDTAQEEGVPFVKNPSEGQTTAATRDSGRDI